MKEGTSIEKHLKHMKELTDRLTAIGAPIHEEDRVVTLLGNLFSVRAASSKGIFIKFGHSRCWIRDKNGKLLGMGTMVDTLYCLDCEIIQSTEATTLATKSRDSDLDAWHYRLGHASEQIIKNMAHKQLASGITLPKQVQLSFCEGCVAGKMTRKPFWSVGEREN